MVLIVHVRSCQWLTSCDTKKQYQKNTAWACNEPVCSACSHRCLEKHSFGYFLYCTILTLIKLSFRYCKVPVKMVSKCWVAARKWWVIELLGKIFWQESVRRVDSILGIIFSFSVICIASPCTQAQERDCCPQLQAALAAGRQDGLAASPLQVQQQPLSLGNCWGAQVTSTYAQHMWGCSHLIAAAILLSAWLCFQDGFLFLKCWCFLLQWSELSAPLESTVLTFWWHFKLTIK